MRNEYDPFTSRSNPDAKRNCQIVVDLDAPTIVYFQELADELGLPYKNLLSLYLQDCAARKHRIGLQPPALARKAGSI